MAERYDLVVIGAGSAGLTAARFGRAFGARVALVERERIGGDCTWTGCVPSKALIHAARVAQEARAAPFLDYERPPSVDFGRVRAFVREAMERVYTFETPDALQTEGIDVVLGEARFLDSFTVRVAGREVSARRIVICTGAEPTIPSVIGRASVPFDTYETIFDRELLPARLVVLGAGPVGVELAQAFQRLGAQVSLLERERHILPGIDREAADVVANAVAADGVAVHCDVEVERIEQMPSGIRVYGSGVEVGGDALLVAAGRRPRTDRLRLDLAGVAVTGGRIVVDGFLRTSQRHIYAAGDVTGGAQFTHYAGWQGAIAARNALLPGRERGRVEGVPWAIFTDPEVAQVGVVEPQATERQGGVRVLRWPLGRNDRAQTEGARAGFVKLVAGDNGVLLGATVVAPAASEIINELSLAVQRKLRLDDLARTIHVYPTYGFSLQQAASAGVLGDVTSGWRGRLVRALAHHRR